MRSANISRKLTFEEAVLIHRRRRAGEACHKLAADFSVNPGRIAEVLRVTLHPGSAAVAAGTSSTEAGRIP